MGKSLHRTVQGLCSAMALFALTGCGTQLLTNRAANPVITDYQSKSWFEPASYGVLSTTADRRSIFMYYKKGEPDPKLCAEAPPDAIDAFTSAVQSSLKGSSPSGISAQAELGNTIQLSSALGLYRSQGLQLLRDRSFALCIAWIQGQIRTNEDWKAMIDNAEKDAVSLIKLECRPLLFRRLTRTRAR
jgi:hypothetical protein